ncbi:uncharacterized protein B0T15DRAFT_536723, partial [Chaetomium strumarium]
MLMRTYIESWISPLLVVVLTIFDLHLSCYITTISGEVNNWDAFSTRPPLARSSPTNTPMTACFAYAVDKGVVAKRGRDSISIRNT